MTPKEQVHFQILRAIEENHEISQRDLARQLGVSNGKVNYLIAALVEKGLLKMAHFGRNGDKLAKVTYLLTPAGVKNRTALTRDYLAQGSRIRSPQSRNSRAAANANRNPGRCGLDPEIAGMGDFLPHHP